MTIADKIFDELGFTKNESICYNDAKVEVIGNIYENKELLDEQD